MEIFVLLATGQTLAVAHIEGGRPYVVAGGELIQADALGAYVGIFSKAQLNAARSDLAAGKLRQSKGHPDCEV